MSEGPNGIQDSRPGGAGPDHADATGADGPQDDPYSWYQRGLELLSRGSPAAAAQILERAATAEPGLTQRPGGAGPRPVRRPALPGGGGQLPADCRGQPGRRLRPLRARPVPGPVRGSRLRGRVPGPGRRHAAGREALHHRPAPGARYAALPDGGRPVGAVQAQRRPHRRQGGRLSEQPTRAGGPGPRGRAQGHRGRAQGQYAAAVPRLRRRPARPRRRRLHRR